MYEQIIYQQQGEVALIRFNRPQEHNAISQKMVLEMEDAILKIEKDTSVRCVIITGGSKVFSIGGDIAFMADANKELANSYIEDCQRALCRIEESGKPYLAAVNGVALGGGLELALACDIRIANVKSRFGAPEIDLGIFPGCGGTQRLARAVGNGWAKYMIFTGKNINAQKAEEKGLIQFITEDNALDEALKLANRLALKSPDALQAAKHCMNYNIQEELPEALKNEKETWVGLFETENQQEGMHAFLEKRKPEFK